MPRHAVTHVVGWMHEPPEQHAHLLLPPTHTRTHASTGRVAAGHYGADCSLSLGPEGRPVVLAGQSYVPRAAGPRVYVYELPVTMTTWCACLAWH